MKNFVFFDSKNTEQTLNARAQMMRNKDDGIGHQESLDAVSREVNKGVNYSEAFDIAKRLSPFVLLKTDEPELTHDTLFLPVNLTVAEHGVEHDAVFYVPVTNHHAALGCDTQVVLHEDEDFVSKLQYSHLGMIDNGCSKGWSVSFYQPHTKDLIAQLELKVTSECVFLEVWSEANGEFTQSVSVDNDELFEMFDLSEISNKAGSISDCVVHDVRQVSNQIGYPHEGNFGRNIKNAKKLFDLI
ncbi:hypothetical protein [Photobacterium kishitanii]|uniref:Uncharacterized protein n=1 Tax=Photobacterium kishitanii TaxID=318456 RepID=A0A2T3KLA3_9GAMM|nr:hypothetical protein [Photobacterium kishitanii]PSV00498.1 hypothetical protein C9J27_05020 [Photobacterium kishitanii]